MEDIIRALETEAYTMNLDQQVRFAKFAKLYPAVPKAKLMTMLLKFVDTFDSEFEQFIMAESGYYA